MCIFLAKVRQTVSRQGQTNVIKIESYGWGRGGGRGGGCGMALSPKCLTHGDNYRLAESKRFKSKILKIGDKERLFLLKKTIGINTAIFKHKTV